MNNKKFHLFIKSSYVSISAMKDILIVAFGATLALYYNKYFPGYVLNPLDIIISIFFIISIYFVLFRLEKMLNNSKNRR